MIQLDIFQQSELEMVVENQKKLQTSLDKFRRSVFSHLSEMQEEILKLREKNEQILS